MSTSTILIIMCYFVSSQQFRSIISERSNLFNVQNNIHTFNVHINIQEGSRERSQTLRNYDRELKK